MDRKRAHTSFDVRQLVIYHREKGKSYREIAKLLNLTKSTVGNIIHRFKFENRIDFKPNNGRRRKLNQRERAAIIRKIKKNPRLSAPKLANEVFQDFGRTVTAQTIRNILKEQGYHSRIARSKNRSKRIKAKDCKK